MFAVRKPLTYMTQLRDLAVLRRENASGAAAKTAPQHVPYY